MRIRVELTTGRIEDVPVAPSVDGRVGSRVEFCGIVRDEEAGAEIAALDYEAYQAMARSTMERILHEEAMTHACLEAEVWHRFGRIPVGEVAIRVVLTSRHRAEGFALLARFMDRLKQEVPIWKVGALEVAPPSLSAAAPSAGMIEVEEAWAIIDARCRRLPAERLPLAQALGRTLDEDVVADRDQPPFDRATMDGYAVRSDEATPRLRVVGEIAAGGCGVAPGPGEAVRIFTGAPVPGAGLRVIMQEQVRREGAFIELPAASPGALNVARRGEDCRAGDVLLPSGSRLDAAALAVLASVGASDPRVVRAPRVLHVTTGDEVVPVDAVPGPSQIRNSNAVLMAGLLGVARHLHLPDDLGRARALLAGEAVETCDVLLFSGGASVGEHDFTRPLLEGLGFEVHFHQVNVRPGKPLIFASRGGTAIAFGIPGNPLSHFVCFHVFIARALARLAGREPRSLEPAVVGSTPAGKPNPRVTFWPARSRSSSGRAVVEPVPWNTSGHLTALTGVNALVRVPAQSELPAPGTIAQVLHLS